MALSLLFIVSHQNISKLPKLMSSIKMSCKVNMVEKHTFSFFFLKLDIQYNLLHAY